MPIRTMSILVLAGAASLASAQSVLFNNAGSTGEDPGLATGTTAANGTPAPFGASWSELQADSTVQSHANAVAGFASHFTGGGDLYRFADDFTISDPTGWVLESVSLYAYQTNALGGASPFTAINVRIWSGRPGDAGSTIVFGDSVTNRLLGSTSSQIYRIFRTTAQPSPQSADTKRLIWKTDASLAGAILGPGTYWIDWQYTGAAPGAEAFSPALTFAGMRTRGGANARQFRTEQAGAWADVVDMGKPALALDLAQDFPFILRGMVRCPGDFNNSGGTPDDSDVAAFFDAWNAGDPSADVNNSGGVPDDADVFTFFVYWAEGC